MCFMEFISVGYELTKYLINRFEIQECGDFTWMVSDCEELVGVTHRRWVCIMLIFYSSGFQPALQSPSIRISAKLELFTKILL